LIEQGRLKQAALRRSPEVLFFLFTIDDREPRHLQLHAIYYDRRFRSTFQPFIALPRFMTDCNEMMEGINQECNRTAGYRVTEMMKIHMDNCRTHNAPEIWQEIRRMKIERLIHPPYLFGLSPGDF
jgi:hypothetical protein